MIEPRLKPWIRVDAHRLRAEAAGAHFTIQRRGCADAGAIAVKLVRLDASFGAPAPARALTAAILGDGRIGWMWLVGPAWAEEPAVDARLERAAAFDPDLWICVVEDREGRPFVDEPITNS